MRERAWAAVLLAACAVAVAATVTAAERDPFEFGPTTQRSSTGGLALIGIVHDQTRALAVIGDQTLRVGDEVAGWRILAIDADAVTIKREAQQLILTPGMSVP